MRRVFGVVRQRRRVGIARRLGALSQPGHRVRLHELSEAVRSAGGTSEASDGRSRPSSVPLHAVQARLRLQSQSRRAVKSKFHYANFATKFADFVAEFHDLRLRLYPKLPLGEVSVKVGVMEFELYTSGLQWRRGRGIGEGQWRSQKFQFGG